MTDQAIAAFGTKLKRGDGASPENFIEIAEIEKLEGPGFKQKTEDTTTHDSAGGWEEFIGTILSAGKVSMTLNFVPTNPTHGAGAGLLKDLVNRTRRNFQMVFPDSGPTTWGFAAIVEEFTPNADFDKALKAKVELRVAGQPTLQ